MPLSSKADSSSTSTMPITTTNANSQANGGLKMPDFSQVLTKDFWLGDYNYLDLLVPYIPYVTSKRFKDVQMPFYGPNERLPIFLALILGLQHALAMVGGLVTPPILLGGASGAALSPANQQYLISASLIWCAFGTCLQVSRIKLGKGYFIGSGILTVTGTSFAVVAVGLTYINNQFKADGTGMCQLAADGSKLPCPEVFGALLGTATVVALLAILMSFVPPKILKRMFPPLVTGSLLLLIGITLITSGINNWAGGAGPCASDHTMRCPSNSAPHAEFWGSPALIGLGFSVFVSISIFSAVGPPIVKNCAVFLGLLLGIAIAAGCGYFDQSTINAAPAATFNWTTTFPLSVKGDLVLPFIAAYFVIIAETIGNVTATAEVSRLPIEGEEFSSRIQGGLLADTAFACIAGLATVPPLTTFSQNIGVVALTRNASRMSGYAAAFFLLLMGVFSKFGAVFVAMPASVLGGMTTFLFCSVAVAGIRILAYVKWTRRTRFIATCSLALGFADVVVPSWFNYFFTYSGNNAALTGFLNAIVLVVSESYLITTVIAIPLNLLLPYGDDDLESEEALPTAFGPSRSEVDALTEDNKEDAKVFV